jgi:catechol 2,3-dioxygenase-like lactoylglutathione lyase family enzyme
VAVSALVRRLARFSLTTADPEPLAAFYEEALGFERIGEEARAGEGFAKLMGIAGARARVVRLRLGRQEVELMGFAPPGWAYPLGSAVTDPLFQHLAIVVADMSAAYTCLSAQGGWLPISTAGPEQLPASSGGVMAFKFRDPDGHPLELLGFPPERTPAAWQGRRGGDLFLGIDHSAITVADTERSIAFYQRLDLSVAGRSLNQGPEQERLDAVRGAIVEVTALNPAGMQTPHLELLCYRAATSRTAMTTRSNHVAATRLVLETGSAAVLAELCAGAAGRLVSPGPVSQEDGSLAALLRDPDGHNLLLLA